MAEHPIQTLVRTAQADFEAILTRQSHTLEMATSEYLRRYKRHPPPGFKEWYEYATRHDSVIIDDFDTIDELLAPFWSLSGAEVKRRMLEVRSGLPSIWHCRFSNGRLEDGCQCLGERLFRLLQDREISKHLREVDLLVNGLDEPRILPKTQSSPLEGFDAMGVWDWTDHSHDQVWHEITSGCNYDVTSKTNRSLLASDGTNTASFRLSSQHLDDVDLCRHSEYMSMHGLWRSPTTFKTTHLRVPILSPAVISTMGDIPFPPAAYTNDAFAYDELEDIPWVDKTAGLYWAGSTTGSFQRGRSYDWKQHHRQRFVVLANNFGKRPHAYLRRPRSDAVWEKYISNALNESYYMVHFTDVVQCEDKTTCDDIRDYFDIHDRKPASEAFNYTLTFDLDGNGHSGRYYRLLNSASLPLKQTVFREWHDERLQPWQHYVPISLSMEELPEVVRYLVEEEEGKRLAKSLAEKGRRWSLRALRAIDQVVYMYRLMLELSRLQDPDRPAS